MTKLFVCSILLLAGLAGFNLHAQPKLVVSTGERFTWGELPNTAKAETTLTIWNRGTDTLILSNIGTSCGCTVTKISNDHILAGDSASLQVSFDAARFAGKVTKLVSMRTNDPRNADYRIHFYATVVPVFELDPQYLFIRAVKDSTVTKSLELHNVSTSVVNILSISSSSPEMKASLTKTSVKPGETTRLEGVFTPTGDGTSTGDIVLKTDHPNLPELSVRFFTYTNDTKVPGASQH